MLMAMIYHVFQPTIRGEERWGYYYRVAGKKKKVIKDPRTRKPFASQDDVESWIAQLRALESDTGPKLAEVAEHLFDEGGEWSKRRARKRDGKPLAKNTLYEHDLITKEYIIPGLGNEAVVDIDYQMIDDWIYSEDVDVTNSFRRNILSTLRQVLKECVRLRLIKAIPYMEFPTKNNRKPSPLTLHETNLLFPEDPAKLRAVWKDRYDKADEGLAFAACSAAMFFGGARPQEARAAHLNQLMTDIWALLIVRTMDSQGKVQEYVKMANARDPRYRGTFLFLQGPYVMQEWLKVRPPESPFLFTFHGALILRDRLQDRLRAAITRAEIPTVGRRFIPYSGRYTFETVIKPALSREDLMMFMGHVDETMPEHYDVPVLIDRMRSMAEIREMANRRLLGGGKVLQFPKSKQKKAAG